MPKLYYHGCHTIFIALCLFRFCQYVDTFDFVCGVHAREFITRWHEQVAFLDKIYFLCYVVMIRFPWLKEKYQHLDFALFSVTH